MPFIRGPEPCFSFCSAWYKKSCGTRIPAATLRLFFPASLHVTADDIAGLALLQFRIAFSIQYTSHRLAPESRHHCCLIHVQEDTWCCVRLGCKRLLTSKHEVYATATAHVYA